MSKNSNISAKTNLSANTFVAVSLGSRWVGFIKKCPKISWHCHFNNMYSCYDSLLGSLDKASTSGVKNTIQYTRMLLQSVRTWSINGFKPLHIIFLTIYIFRLWLIKILHIAWTFFVRKKMSLQLVIFRTTWWDWIFIHPSNWPWHRVSDPDPIGSWINLVFENLLWEQFWKVD